MSKRKGEAGHVEWPIAMRCADCGSFARAYPFPAYEDADLFEDPEEVTSGATQGTVWCSVCDPPWGEYLLLQMTVASHRRYGWPLADPTLPPWGQPLGGYPREAIAFVEAELADFFTGPGSLSAARPHWAGEGPCAPRGADFWYAAAGLVAFMRERRGIGFLSYQPVKAAA